MRWALVAVAVGFAALAPEAGLEPRTLAAYERYLALTADRVEAERRGEAPFLWIDRQPAAQRAALMARLQRGEVVVTKLETRDGGREVGVPGGLIHHWVGTVLMPNVPVDRVLSFVEDYDRYPTVFDPLIQRARVLERRVVDDRTVRYDVTMRTYVKKAIAVVMDATYRIDYHRISPTRVATTNTATDFFQVHDAGTPSERREPGDQASGYLWRFQMYCAFDERPEGSLEQCESVSLTRSIPFALGWIVGPFVNGIPRDTLEFTLSEVRSAVASRQP